MFSVLFAIAIGILVATWVSVRAQWPAEAKGQFVTFCVSASAMVGLLVGFFIVPAIVPTIEVVTDIREVVSASTVGGTVQVFVKNGDGTVTSTIVDPTKCDGVSKINQGRSVLVQTATIADATSPEAQWAVLLPRVPLRYCQELYLSEALK